MSAKQLCMLLDELGIRDSTHTPESLAWTCQQEGARLLVKWLCNNISKENVLTLEELAEYNQLKQQGKVLQGEELDEAYWRLTRGSEEEEAELDQACQDIIEETEDLKEAAESLTRRLDRLQAQAKALESQKLFTASCTAGREQFAEDAKRRQEEVMAELAEQDQEIKALTDRITKGVQQLERDYTGEEDGGRPHLFTTSFGPFLRQNEILQRELSMWHQQMFEGRHAGDLDGGAMSPPTEHGKEGGPGESQHQRRVQELERLSRVYGRAEEQKVLALAGKAREEAILETARTQLSTRRNIVESETSLRAKTAEMKALIDELEGDEKRWRKQVADLCVELGQLNSTYVVEGDYELKRQRQEYYLERYQQFLGHLTDQLACHVVLLKACNLEKEAQRDACALLQAAEAELAAVASTGNARKERYTAFQEATASDQDGKGMKMQDPVIQQLGTLLEVTPSEESGEVTPDAVIEKLQELGGQLAVMRERVDLLQTRERDTVFLDLRKAIERAHGLLYTGPSSDQPEFTPEEVLKSVEQLDTLSTSLNTAVEKIGARQRRLHHVLESMGEAMEVERRVFVDFFCNPDRLRATEQEFEQAIRRSRARQS